MKPTTQPVAATQVEMDIKQGTIQARAAEFSKISQ
jgi:hypothetical protein